MPKQLSPEEFEAMFGGGAPAEVPQDVGLGTMLGSGARRLGAVALGIGEAVGLSSGDWRREQQAIANADAQRYFEQTGAPRSFAEAQGLGETAQWLAGVGAQSLPSMIPVAAAGLMGGPGAAFAAGSALGLGDVLQNQREAGGRTDLTTAIPLGLAYGAADRFGIEGMFARRSLGTGVRALDALGAGQLDKLTGFTGATARAAATGAKGMLAEGTAETLQEFANQAGRTAVSSETMFDPEAVSRYQESFIAGSLLGGAVSGGLGGWRRSAADDGGATDLTARGAQPAVGVTPDQIKPEVQPFTQDWFNKALGVDETLYATDKNYAKAVGNLFEEGSGQFVQDTSSMAGHERELSMADAIMLRNGAIKMDDLQRLWQIEAIQGPMPRPGFVPPSAEPGTPTAPTAPSADRAGSADQGVDIDAEILARLGGKKVPKFARELWEHMRAGGITPTDPEVADPFWNLAAKTGLNSQKQLDKVLAAMDAWAISNAAPAAPAAPAPAPAPQVGLQAPMAQPVAPGPRVFQQGVLQPAAPAGSAPVDLTAPRAPSAPTPVAAPVIAPRAPSAPTPAAALVTPVTPVEPVMSRKRRVQPVAGAPAAYVAPEGEAPASISPQRAALNLPKDADLRIAAEIAQVAGQKGLAAELEAQVADADVGVALADAREMPMDEVAADAIFREMFHTSEKTGNQAKFVEQAKKLLKARQVAPEAAKTEVLKAVASAMGLNYHTAKSRIDEPKMVQAGIRLGYTESQVLSLLGIRAKSRGGATALSKAQKAYKDLQNVEQPTQEQVQQMADLKGQIEQLEDADARTDAAGASKEMSKIGIEFDADEGSGMSVGDGTDRWWSQEASGTVVDRAIGKLATLERQIQELRTATAQLRSMGPEFRSAARATRDAAAKAKKSLPVAMAEAEASAIQEQNRILRESWTEAKKAKEEVGAKPPKVVRAPVVAESKATPEQQAAQARWKAANRKLELLSTEDLQTLLPYVRGKMQNAELAGKITDLLKTRGVDDAVQVESAAEVPAQPEARAGGEVGQKVPSAEKPAGKGGKTESRPQAEKVSAPAVIKTQRELAAEAWDAVATGIPGAPKFAELTRAQQTDFVEFGEDNWTPADVRREMQRMPPATPPRGRSGLTDESNIIDVEARVLDETVRPQVAALPAPQVQQLEKHYGLKRDSAEFLAKVKEDVVLYATRGAEAVAGAIRHIIKSIANGVLSVAMIFNPMHITAPEAFVVVPRAEVVTTTREVKAELPSDVKGMSEAGKQAYAMLIPALKGKNGDKLITIADKPSGQIFVFDANGNLVAQKKALFGLAKGDLYKGNNDLPKNRITPAGLFGLKLVDAAKGGSAAKTAGEYDFGKVFAFEDPDAVVTIMHSVWLKEKDAAKRSAALKDANPANSRYSFGCINVDKDTYKFLLDNYQSQMDGSKLFIVPDAQAKVGDFLAGNVPYDKMNRQSVGKTMETVTTTVGGGDVRAGGRDQNQAGKKEDDLPSSSSNRYGVPAAKATNPYTAKQLLKELKDFVRADIPGRKLLVVDDISELLTHPDRAVQVVGAGMAVKGAYGVASDGRAFLVANRIEQGQGRAKFMHEVGSHLGLEKLLPKATYNRLVKQVKVWADSNADTDEAYLAERALARAYKVSDSQTEFDDEILAYFLEEAVSGGIDPTADVDGGPLREWFRTLWNAFKTALIKLGFRPSTLTAQDVVDLAFGAARLELSSAYYGAPVDADRQRLRFGVAAPKKATAGQVQRAINQLPAQVQPAVRDSLDTMGNWGNKALDRVVFTSDLIGFASQAGLQAAKSFGDNLARRDTKARELEREVEKIADLYALVPEKDRGLVPEKGQSDTANQFIFDSTREGKWGFGKYADRDMRGRFEALSAEAQAFVKAVFDHGDKMLALKKKTVMDHTNTEYDALIAAAAADGDAALEAKLKGEKQAVITRFKDLFATQEGRPYAPIKRMGTYAVVAKSQAYRDAEAAGNQKQIQTMQKQADHYHVSFTEGRAEARELARQLQAQGHFGRDGDAVDFFEREANMDALFGGDSVLRALTKLQSQVEAKQAAGEAGAAKLRRMVTDLYLEALAENSARKTEMKRRGVAGEVDMLRSFTTQGRADANFLASVEYNRKIQDSIQAMRKERDRGGNRARKAELFNELTARYAQSMEDSSTPALRKLLHLSSAYYLMTSPAYYLANLTQPWMMSVPVMAGKHGYAAASSAQFVAYKDLKAMIMSSKLLSGRQFDYSLVGNTAGEKNAIQELANRGRIDIGMETELGEFRVEGAGPVKDRLNKVNKGLRMLVQKGEILNRMSTALAAYRLELARNGGDTAAATDYADRILTETHGDYGRFNAPRMFNTSVGKVALQFRKFQLIQLSYYAKMLRSAGFTTQEQRAATKALTYSLLHTAAFAGLRGLPGFAAAQFLAAALLGDEDKKYDLAAEIEGAIGDKDWARLVMRGAPTLVGLDLSGSVGAGNALSVMPFSNADLSTPSGQFEAFGQLVGGAGGGMVVRGLDGLGLMKNGDWYKGLELLMPKGLSSAMQAYRIADEGMTRRNGDVILPPEDVSELETFWKALSFTTPGMAETYENRQRFQDIKDRFTDRASKIKNAYAKAVRSNDSNGRQAAREAWVKLQSTRKAEGFQPQPLSNLLKAPQEQAKREKQTVGGVQYRPNEKAAAWQVAGE